MVCGLRYIWNGVLVTVYMVWCVGYSKYGMVYGLQYIYGVWVTVNMVWCVGYSTYGMVCGLQYIWYGV